MSQKRDFYAEVLPMILELDPEGRRWVLDSIRELLNDIRADLILQEALGSAYEPIDLRTWQPSCPPPEV